MKSIVLTGDKTTVYCETCDEFAQATYSYGSFSFDSGVVAENVMRAECDTCGDIVAVAHQSTPLLKEALETRIARTTMRLPPELLDYVGLQLDKAGANPSQYDLFLRALLMACHGNEEVIGKQVTGLQDPVLGQPNTATLNLSWAPNLNKVIQQLLSSSGLTNVSELLRRLIVLTEQPSLGKPVAQEALRLILAYT